MSRVIQTYDQLFRTLARTGPMLFRPDGARTELQTGTYIKIPGGPQLRALDIFTLDYNIVIERYFVDRGVAENLYTGFTPRGMEFIYHPEEYVYKGGKTNLIKLHGSITNSSEETPSRKP